MADLDLETVEQVARWCAEAGRQAGTAEIRAALGGLSWDEVLALRALLADPPPARPLGPYALADLARGAPLDAAVEREREGRYPKGPPAGPPEAPDAAAAPEEAPARATRKRGKARLQVVIRKKVAPAPAAPPPLRPLLDELMLPAGRAALERLIRAHGGKRPALVAALAASHRRADGEPVDDGTLTRLLDHHGLARGFARRERDEVLHAVRAAGGVLSRAAAALGHDLPGLHAAVERLGCGAEVESLRAARRRELAGRATLSDRARLLLADPERLAEFGLLQPFEAELKARLPELLEVLGRSGEPLALALSRSLSLPATGLRELATRLGFDLGPVTFQERESGDRPPPRFRADQPERPPRPARSGPPRGDRPPRTGPRPASARPGPVRSGPPGERPPREDRPPRAGGPRPRPAGGERTPRPPRAIGDRTARPPRAGGPPRADRPAGSFRPRPAGGPRSERPASPGWPTGRPASTGSSRPASAGPRAPGPRSSGPRTGAPRPGGPRPSAGGRPGGPPRGPRRPPR